MQFSQRAPLVCVSGRERDAYEVLCDLDDLDWVPEDLDRAMTYPRVAVDVLSLEWRASEVFAPSRLAGRSPGRMLLTDVDLNVNYSSFPRLTLASRSLQDAILISSAVADGTQRPALDLDFPAALLRDGDGVSWLWIDPHGPALDYHGPDAVDWADRAMAALGLVRCADAPSGPLEDLAPFGRLAGALAGGWDGALEPLWQALESLEPSGAGTAPAGGVWYRVSGGAWLVPSTSWWHLYLDTVLDTDTYLMVVDVLAGCGLLNPGFALATRDRGFSCLRRPGLLKPSPVVAPLGIDVIPF